MVSDFDISQGNVTHYDYDGLSRQVVVERKPGGRGIDPALVRVAPRTLV